SQVGIAGECAGIRIPEVVSRTAGAMTVSIQPTSPSQLTFGSVLYGTVSNLNTTASTMTATDKLFLTTPSSTRIELGPLATKVHVKAGGSKAITFGVTTSALTAQTGSFSLEVDAVDTAGTIQGTAIAPFTINP